MVAHAACKSIYDPYCGTSDAEIEALADADGYMGLVTFPWFIVPAGSKPGIEVLLDHLEHAASILGPVGPAEERTSPPSTYAFQLRRSNNTRHIDSLGFDAEQVERRTGIAGGLVEIRTYTHWPVIESAVRDRFGGDADGILGGNVLDVWERGREL